MKKHSFLKIAVIALFTAILFSLLAFSVSAATVSVNSETVQRGEEVTFTATLSEELTVGSGSVAVVYDSDVLEFLGGNTAGVWNVPGAMLTNFDAAHGLGAFMYQTSAAVSGDIFSVTFKVKDNAPLDETTDVELNITLKDGSNADIALTNTKGSVTVECIHSFTAQNTAETYKVSGATCIAKAVYNYSCVHCGAEGTETFEYGDFADHTFTKQITTDEYKVSGATCTAKAVYNYACSVCDEEGTTTYEYGDKLPHTFTKQIITDDYKVSGATCTAKAVYNYACSVCDEEGTTTYEYGEMLDHTFTKQIITDDYKVSSATCTAKAVYNYACVDCDLEGTDTFEYGDFAEHIFIKQIITDDYKVSGATCTAKAVYNYACDACDAESNIPFEYGEKLPHTFTKQIITDDYKVSNANCVDKAVYNYACSVCDEEGDVTFEYGETADHDYTKQIITDDYKVSDASCTSPAIYNYACAGCDLEGTVTYEYGDKLPHTFTKQIITDDYKVSGATCTAKAVYNYACSVCDEEGDVTFEYGEMLDHTFTKQIITDDYKVSSATCTAKAVYNYACVGCDLESDITFEYGEKLPHTFTKQIITDDYKVSDASCTAKAVYNYACSVCDEEGDVTFEYGEMLPHDFTKQMITDDYKVSDATCMAKAVYNYACQVCELESDITFEYGEKNANNHTNLGAWHTDDTKHWHVCECTATVDEGEHVAGNWIVHDRPTYEKPGERHKECRTCGHWMVTEPMDQLVRSPIILVNYKLIASAGEGGTITNSGTTTVRINDKVSYTITPNAGYMIKAVYVDGVSVGAVFKYDFANIRANHTITAEFVKYENKFTDVPADKLDIVNFVATRGLFNGVSETEFAPNAKMTRAMFVTVLGRLAGVNEEYKGAMIFTDVVAGEWYAPYVAWATDNGLIEGYGDGTFGVKDEITVEQACAILARYTDRMYGLKNIVSSLRDYADGGKVSTWAENGVKWAVGNDVITATNGKLVPQTEPARIAVAEIFYNYAKNVLNIK